MEKESILKLIVYGIATVPWWVLGLLILKWLIPIVAVFVGFVPLSVTLLVVMLFITFIISIFIILRWLYYHGFLK